MDVVLLRSKKVSIALRNGTEIGEDLRPFFLQDFAGSNGVSSDQPKPRGQPQGAPRELRAAATGAGHSYPQLAQTAFILSWKRCQQSSSASRCRAYVPTARRTWRKNAVALIAREERSSREPLRRISHPPRASPWCR